MEPLFDRLLREGEAALAAMCDEAEEETLHLEFKTLSDHSGVHLFKEDKRLIAKAICGLSNAEGGVLILGIKTERRDNLDVAKAQKPFDNCHSLRNRIVAALPDLLSPQHTKIRVDQIPHAGGPSGYVIIDVPPSDLRPHMSIAEHRYFRRGSDGTRMMEHGEVRDLMFAPKTGQMMLDVVPVPGMVIGGCSFEVTLECRLVNTGRVAISAPYLQCSGSLHLNPLPGAATGFILPRAGARGIGLYTGRDTLLHTDDTLTIGGIPVGLYVRPRTGRTPRRTVEHALNFDRFEDVVIFHPWGTGHGEPSPNLFGFIFHFGAENVPMQEIAYGPRYSESVRHLAKVLWPDITPK
jgi:hypothetical protein